MHALLKLLDQPCFINAVKYVIETAPMSPKPKNMWRNGWANPSQKPAMGGEGSADLYQHSGKGGQHTMKEAGIPAVTDRTEDQNFIEYR